VRVIEQREREIGEAETSVFVTWAPFSRRTETLADRRGMTVLQVGAPWFKRPWAAPLKYPLQMIRTVRALRRLRPSQVWVMDPPLPAVAVAWAYARRRSLPLVVDIHSVGFYGAKWRSLRPLEKPLLRYAAAVIVTNEELAARVREWGATPVVLPDPLPDPPLSARRQEVDDSMITVVATYSEDEPIDALPEVARRLADVTIHVTGRPRVPTERWPRNLRATGFLQDGEYWDLLARSAAVVVLTTRPNTLLSGAYEALSLQRPLVVSDHEVLRRYHADAAVYVNAKAESIADGIGMALSDTERLSEASRALATRRDAEWAGSARVLDGLLSGEPRS
jgi:glycosyltransferase involved in cell wall biosynthesis